MKKRYWQLIFAVLLFLMVPALEYLAMRNVDITSADLRAAKGTRSDPPRFSFSAGGDMGDNSTTSATLDLIAKSSVDFHLAIGDLSYGEVAPETALCEYVQSHVGATFPFELLSGNHEDGAEETGGGIIDNYVKCLPNRIKKSDGSDAISGTYGSEYYFDYPPRAPIARFILISPGMTYRTGGFYGYSVGTSHYNWVANTIDKARAAGIKWVIVAMHKNCISMGIKTCEIGNDIFNLLVSKKVDLILQGHDHTYQRSKQLALNSTTCIAIQAETYNRHCVVNDGSTGRYTKGSGTVLVITGTVGADLYPISTSDGDAGFFARWMGSNDEPTHGFTKFTVSTDRLDVAANFLGSTGPKYFTDSFTITRSSST